MGIRTKKVGITGKYATRYGQKLRKQVKAIEILQRVRSICPFCGKKSIKRQAAGIWKCRGCRRAIAGGAWEFVTTAATTAKTTINRLKKNLESRKKRKELEKERNKYNYDNYNEDEYDYNKLPKGKYDKRKYDNKGNQYRKGYRDNEEDINDYKDYRDNNIQNRGQKKTKERLGRCCRCHKIFPRKLLSINNYFYKENRV